MFADNNVVAEWMDFRKEAEWISSKLNIQSRYSAYDFRKNELTDFTEIDLIKASIENLLTDYPLDAKSIDAILINSSSTSTPTPDPSCVVHSFLGCREDIFVQYSSAGCAGAFSLFKLASDLLQSSRYKKILVVSSSLLSRTITETNKDTTWLQAVIFGDAAASFVLEEGPPGAGFSEFSIKTDNSLDVVSSLHDRLVFDYRQVPENLKNLLPMLLREACEKHNFNPKNNWVLFNNSNYKIQKDFIDAIEAKTILNIDRVGNCASASLGLVMCDFLALLKTSSESIFTEDEKRVLILTIGTGLQLGYCFYTFKEA